MKLQLGKYELEYPDGATIHVSDDGKIKVDFPISEPEVIEKIRVVEVPGPVQETIRFIPTPSPTIVNPDPIYPQPFTPWSPTYPGPGTPYSPSWTSPNWTTTGTITVGDTQTVTGTIDHIVTNPFPIGGIGTNMYTVNGGDNMSAIN
jgi:hypothetical protein